MEYPCVRSSATSRPWDLTLKFSNSTSDSMLTSCRWILISKLEHVASIFPKWPSSQEFVQILLYLQKFCTDKRLGDPVKVHRPLFCIPLFFMIHHIDPNFAWFSGLEIFKMQNNGDALNIWNREKFFWTECKNRLKLSNSWIEGPINWSLKEVPKKISAYTKDRCTVYLIKLNVIQFLQFAFFCIIYIYTTKITKID